MNYVRLIFLLLVFVPDYTFANAFDLNESESTSHVEVGADSIVREIDEITIIGDSRKNPYLKNVNEGKIELSVKTISEMASPLGSPDILRSLQYLPVATVNSELRSGIYIQGTDQSATVYHIDGGEVINPSHLLGLYSVFNTSHYDKFSIMPMGVGVGAPECIGGFVVAGIAGKDIRNFEGKVNVGLIDSHVTLKIPLSRNGHNLILSGRISYLDKVFPSLLKFDNLQLGYGFNDQNITYIWNINQEKSLRINLFHSHDNLALSDAYYDSDMKFAWRNMLGNIVFENRYWHHDLFFSSYSNNVDIRMGDIKDKMPSSLGKIGYMGIGKYGDFRFQISTNAVVSTPQSVLKDSGNTIRRYAWDATAGGEYSISFSDLVRLKGCFKGMVYAGHDFTHFYPLPSFFGDVRVWKNMSVGFTYGMRVQTLHSIVESEVGLPTDFRITSNSEIHPQRAHSFSLRFGGGLFDGILDFNLEGYCNLIKDMTEYSGSVLNILFNGFNPNDQLLTGKGRSYGFSISVFRNYGAVKGWIAYKTGRSEMKMYGADQKWYPASFDRRHELTATVSWKPLSNLQIGASYCIASGTPYTAPKYAYMLGENIICEYYPHNSSRLPWYKRLDLSVNWDFLKTGYVKHKLNFSFYNVLFNRNVLFRYVSFSNEDGIGYRDMVMKNMIPSVSYNIEF